MDSIYFNTDGQLNNAGIALYADAMLWNRVSDLPDGFSDFVATEPTVMRKIIHIYHALKTQALPSSHPYFDALMVSDDASIDALLQQFLGSDACLPYAIYEAEMEGTLMSAPLFKQSSPIDGAYFETDILFAWGGDIAELHLVIENNDLDVVFEGTIENGFTLSLSENDMADGLYYYKFIQGEEMIRLGKFYVYRGRSK